MVPRRESDAVEERGRGLRGPGRRARGVLAANTIARAAHRPMPPEIFPHAPVTGRFPAEDHPMHRSWLDFLLEISPCTGQGPFFRRTSSHAPVIGGCRARNPGSTRPRAVFAPKLPSSARHGPMFRRKTRHAPVMDRFPRSKTLHAPVMDSFSAEDRRMHRGTEVSPLPRRGQHEQNEEQLEMCHWQD